MTWLKALGVDYLSTLKVNLNAVKTPWIPFDPFNQLYVTLECDGDFLMIAHEDEEEDVVVIAITGRNNQLRDVIEPIYF